MAHVADDLVDVADDPLDQDGRAVVAGLLEQVGQGRSAAFIGRRGLESALRVDPVAGQLAQ